MFNIKLKSFLKEIKYFKYLKNKTISEIKIKNHIDFQDCLMLSWILFVSILLAIAGFLPETFLLDPNISTSEFQIIIFGSALSIIFIGFFDFIIAKSKVVFSISTSFEYAEFLIKNKSKQVLEKEIEDLIKNNSFIQHYLNLYKNQQPSFNETFSNLLKELNEFYKYLDIDKDFIKEFHNIEDNCSFIAFLIYLNNCYFLMNNEKYLNYQKMKNSTTQIQQLEHLKENLLPSFKINGTGFVKSIDFLKIK